jgi:hypothetical protein
MIEVPKAARVNFIGFANGIKEGGKSTLVRKWAKLFPRRIVLDFVAEEAVEVPGAIECLTLGETLDAMADVVHEQRREFTIVSSIRPTEVAKLCNVLAPLDNPRGGYSLGVDGILLDCSECELVWPNDGRMSEEAANLIHRGRHYRVSVAAATRRTRDVSRLLTSQSDVVACFRQQEARDLKSLAENLGEFAASKVAALPQYWYLQMIPRSGRMSIIEANGQEHLLENPATALPETSLL